MKDFNNITDPKRPKGDMGEIDISAPDKILCNKLAVVAMIFSLVSIFGLDLAGVVGAVLGIVAFGQINSSKEKGLIFAILAIVIGIVCGFGIVPFTISLGF
ncbi:hypothetical protein CVU82_02705 [Candidatus Falkowbacteria bacterium HGW-Falkowbacteria-1]|jgi:hypothetical protein|uniref:Uncharacterized protein n=1 Tax=Candidatus Falkowbacteria bacterium HGW-Falkowbacteria-1 TaxID=2013768 RepID=A0A2N2E9Y2_9BACT|nr:MAG: hypothetical protein CVU82_02705 [Candidatus Falkowbacteria bacterium HGW-Falkowbacteria-1]